MIARSTNVTTLSSVNIYFPKPWLNIVKIIFPIDFSTALGI